MRLRTPALASLLAIAATAHAGRPPAQQLAGPPAQLLLDALANAGVAHGASAPYTYTVGKLGCTMVVKPDAFGVHHYACTLDGNDVPAAAAAALVLAFHVAGVDVVTVGMTKQRLRVEPITCTYDAASAGDHYQCSLTVLDPNLP